jgi:hypothetical protein
MAVVIVHDAILDQEPAKTKGLFEVLAAKASGCPSCRFGSRRARLSYVSVGTLNDVEVLLLLSSREVRERGSIYTDTSLRRCRA